MALDGLRVCQRSISGDVLNESIIGQDIVIWLEFQFYPLAVLVYIKGDIEMREVVYLMRWGTNNGIVDGRYMSNGL
jgi:hypothetical protein